MQHFYQLTAVFSALLLLPPCVMADCGFAPNGYGLCDMAGNLHEWCWDSYVPYVAGTQNDPRVSNAGSYRVRRGGYWGNNAVGCRVAARLDGRPGSEYTTIGFRVARSSIP